MSSLDKYTSPVSADTWDVPAAGATRFTWEYDGGRERLLNLYQKGKDKQWDAQTRIDWDLPVDENNPLGLPDEFNPLKGYERYERMPAKELDILRRHNCSWIFSQFLHGEQGAMSVAARVVESVPDLDAKFYAATQVMDEARHVELFSKFANEKIGMLYPINDGLARLLSDALSDGRWDMPYLGMQVLIEGLALATFGVYRDLATNPMVKQLLAFVMQDEARHVAFGRLALRDYYSQITEKERAEREEFVVEGCYLMRDRFQAKEVFERVGLPVDECVKHLETSEIYTIYQSLLFSRIVPCVRDIGLWGDKVQAAYADIGVLDAARSDLDALMRQDEEIAEGFSKAEAEAELDARRQEVDAAVAAGAESD
ncbi:ferritin-like domain-containing protein [Streptomyces odontomachi]|uniref:ferritin-like domain-containing protein n=1 Tax=Streptomyces odontomachi TaxID=2944940 RepID=UPI00210DD614|nr:ferritin-like domain-containing protein [Streptomyces sp. ODS25]